MMINTIKIAEIVIKIVILLLSVFVRIKNFISGEFQIGKNSFLNGEKIKFN